MIKLKSIFGSAGAQAGFKTPEDAKQAIKQACADAESLGITAFLYFKLRALEKLIDAKTAAFLEVLLSDNAGCDFLSEQGVEQATGQAEGSMFRAAREVFPDLGHLIHAREFMLAMPEVKLAVEKMEPIARRLSEAKEALSVMRAEAAEKLSEARGHLERKLQEVEDHPELKAAKETVSALQEAIRRAH